jgi:NADP-dependent alcohol dehydrogenase
MIGHELTAAHGIDHARTLSIVLPAVLKVRRSVKREKLLQYADRVWGIKDGDEDARVDQAIAATEAFFTAMGLPVRLSEVDLGAEHIDELLAKLTEHGMVKLGEQGEVTPVISRQILEMAV